MSTLERLTKEKRVLFITTKNIDYIRNSQEIRILEKNAKFVKKIYSAKKRYLERIFEVWRMLIQYNISDIDVVYVGFSPQLIFPFFRKFFGKIIIIDFFISVYDTLVNDRKKVFPKGLVAKICHGIDSYVIEKADIVITDTKADALYFIQEFHGEMEKFKVLYLEADKKIYFPREQHKEKRLENKFVVLYFGSILPLQGIDVILKAIRMLEEEKNIYFQIIGPIPKKYKKPIQENVEYIEWLKQKQLAEYIANADLCLAGHFNKDIDKAKRTIPGKAYMYEAMEKIMILGDSEANREYFEESKKNRYVKLGSPQELSNLILKMYYERLKGN